MHFRSKFLYKLKKLFHNKKSSAVIGITTVLLFLFYLFSTHSQTTLDQTYLIGIDERWKDIEIFGKEKNFSAFSHDLLLAIAREEKIRFKLISVRPDELEKAMHTQEIQGILTGLPPSIIQRRTYEFSNSAYALGPVLIVPSDTTLRGWDEMSRKIVGVYGFSPTVLLLQKNYAIQIRLYDDIKRALIDLDNGKIDGVIYPVLPALTFTKTFYNGKLKVITNPLDDEGVHLVTMKDARGKQLIQEFNAGLKKIKENGIYQNLLDRWNLSNTEKIPNVIPPLHPDPIQLISLQNSSYAKPQTN